MVPAYRPGDSIEVGKVVFDIIGVGIGILVIRPVRLVQHHSLGSGMTLAELRQLAEQFSGAQDFIDELAPIIRTFEYFAERIEGGQQPATPGG